jgi:hypothetical protein
MISVKKVGSFEFLMVGDKAAIPMEKITGIDFSSKLSGEASVIINVPGNRFTFFTDVAKALKDFFEGKVE